MRGPDRSCVMRFAEAQAHIPGPSGEHAVVVLRRGPLDVALSIPREPRHQTPHLQDELYFIIRGGGFLVHDGKRDRLQPGDILFVAAGVEHQFENKTYDFALWRVFYGPLGGEVPA